LKDCWDDDDFTVTVDGTKLSSDRDEDSSNESWVITDFYVALVDEEAGCGVKHVMIGTKVLAVLFQSLDETVEGIFMNGMLIMNRI
jgi:hypothetical protein